VPNSAGGPPEYQWDMCKDPLIGETRRELEAWERENRKDAEAFMAQAESILQNGEFPREMIKSVIQTRKLGVARDIIKEAKTGGYTAVVARRRGYSNIPEIFLGSVADKLVNGLEDVPLFLAGRDAPTNKLLIAMDNSVSSVEAANFVGDFFDPAFVQITLFHVIRNQSAGISLAAEESLNRSHYNLMEEVFLRTRKRLIEAGFSPDQIEEKMEPKALSRVGTLAREAEKEEVSTLVIGRKGVSQVREFFLGRVSKKLVYAARNKTVCLV